MWFSTKKKRCKPTKKFLVASKNLVPPVCTWPKILFGKLYFIEVMDVLIIAKAECVGENDDLKRTVAFYQHLGVY